MTTWRELILKEMEKHNDNAVAYSSTMTKEEMDVEFDNRLGCYQGIPFTLWTCDRVYFPVTYDGARWVGSVSRNPDEKPTEHIGGG